MATYLVMFKAAKSVKLYECTEYGGWSNVYPKTLNYKQTSKHRDNVSEELDFRPRYSIHNNFLWGLSCHEIPKYKHLPPGLEVFFERSKQTSHT